MKAVVRGWRSDLRVQTRRPQTRPSNGAERPDRAADSQEGFLPREGNGAAPSLDKVLKRVSAADVLISGSVPNASLHSVLLDGEKTEIGPQKKETKGSWDLIDAFWGTLLHKKKKRD